MPILPPSCAIVCHDAGAANIVFAWLAAERPAGVRVHAAGPAARIAAQVDVGTPCASIDQALDGVSMLVSGTGWASDVEHEARKLARAAGVRSIAVLDHWVNYAQRFERGGQTVLPDEFWVTDHHAAQIARETFAGARVLVQPNLYLEEMLAQIRSATEVPDEVLFLLEPLRSDFGRGQPGEFQALDYFVAALPRLGLSAQARIRLRPHPSDAEGKYDAWAAAHGHLNVERTPACEPLPVAIGRAALVVGCHSYAMAIAVQAGKRVLCALPPWAPPCVLPFPQIQHLARS